MGEHCFGMLFGVMELQPVPAIILAQALNGVILPIIAVILFLLIDNSYILPEGHQNGLDIVAIFIIVIIPLIKK